MESQQQLRAKRPRWAMVIASKVGVKLRSVYRIIQNYIDQGYQVIQPPRRKGGPPDPLNQEQIDFVLDHETVRLWTPLTIEQRIEQLKLKYDTPERAISPSPWYLRMLYRRNKITMKNASY